MSIEPSVVELNRVFQGAVGCINYFDAGLRAVYEAGVAAERARCARIVEAERDGAYAHPDVIEGIAAAIGEGVVDQ